MSRVELFFDFISPYAYFASEELPRICERHGAALTFRPILFAGLLDHFGHLGPAEIPIKAQNTFRDTVRHAVRRDIPFQFPKYHPFKSVNALRLALELVSGADQPAIVRTLFRAGWQEGEDMGDPDALTRALDKAGFDGAALLSRTRDADVKAALRSETERAADLGVFGVPTMIIDDELYWGKDRLGDVETHLVEGNPLSGIDPLDYAPQGASAVRPRSQK